MNSIRIICVILLTSYSTTYLNVGVLVPLFVDVKSCPLDFLLDTRGKYFGIVP